jgi:phosphatidylserine decarboxylase
MLQKTQFRVGLWLPSDQKVLDRWLAKHIQQAEQTNGPLHPVIQNFRDFIEADAQVFMWFNQMFEQVPKKPPYNLDPTKRPQLRDYRQMLRVLNLIMTEAPEFNETDLVGFPINAILDWSMGTEAGTAAFLNDKVNQQLRSVLNEYARFLGSPDSCSVLNYDARTGWLGEDAMNAMPGFEQDFVCDPELAHYGFTSWDDFFTRRLRPGARPIAAPHDDDVIVNACESAPYRLAHEVKLEDQFWIKAQPYSLRHLMRNDVLTEQFAGGTIYQAFLSALSYHRWHSPVSGEVVKAYVIDGSYYAEALAEGFDPAGPNESQAYISQVATRSLIFIQADNPRIGLMCFVAIGMAEVSTCQITVYEGQRVKKGDPLGTFHFGGSTHCLVFRPEAALDFDCHGQHVGLNSKPIAVNARIATVRRA